MKKCRLNAQGKPRERFEGLRIDAYREWIREQPCLLAGRDGHICWSPEKVRDAAHVESKARGAGDAGNLVSLCRRAHQELHAFGTKSFQRTYGMHLRTVAGELWLEYERAKGVGL